MSELSPDERKALQVARAAFEESENYGASWDDFIFTAGRDCERKRAVQTIRDWMNALEPIDVWQKTTLRDLAQAIEQGQP